LIRPLEALDAARGSLLPWAPVFLSLGIGPYFLLPREPGPAVWGAALAAFLAAVAMARRGPVLSRVPAMAAALVAAGFALAVLRAHAVSAPVLSFRYYGPVEGRIVDIDRSFSDQPRITLDRLVLSRTSPERTPGLVRIALHGDAEGAALEPGLRVILTTHLSPPDGPVEPGGFDFQRLAWFSGLGGVGYSRTPVLELAPPDRSLGLAAFRVRMWLSKGIQEAIGGQSGAFAAALMTGDRSAVDAATNEALRNSNLSHLISISGLHMGLLSGFVFGALRYGLALVPPLALRLNTKKLAAAVALVAATLYLILAGPDVATRRAWVMVTVMLVAVLADRRAISLRSVAIAALVLLAIEPESLVEPGFQMSFGATVALIVTFGPWAKMQEKIPRLMRPAAMLVLSSLAAGTATAPIAAVHFNRIAEYGLIANFAAVPIMGLIVMPAGVIAAVLATFGLAGPALWAMGVGTTLILQVANHVAALDGAVRAVPTPPSMVLPLLGLGGVAAFIARPLWLRSGGAALAAVAFALWVGAERPALLIAGDGGLVGVMGEEGRILSKPKGGGFIAKNWLEDDGDPALQDDAFVRGGTAAKRGTWQGRFGDRPIYHLTGKTAPERAAALCATAAPGTMMVLNGDWPEGADRHGCEVFDQSRLRRTGALAFRNPDEGTAIITARQVAGERLWNSRAADRRQRLAAAQ
jgi:competence protein ComEC